MKALPFGFLSGSESFSGMITEWTVSDGQTITLEGQIGAWSNLFI